MGRRKRKSERIVGSPSGNVHIPMRAKTSPRSKNGLPARGKAFNQLAAHRMGKEEDTTRLLIKGELEGWGPERGMREERNYPLRLQCWNLSRRREEVDPP